LVGVRARLFNELENLTKLFFRNAIQENKESECCEGRERESELRKAYGSVTNVNKFKIVVPI
jgi:hypothetical protein